MSEEGPEVTSPPDEQPEEQLEQSMSGQDQGLTDSTSLKETENAPDSGNPNVTNSLEPNQPVLSNENPSNDHENENEAAQPQNQSDENNNINGTDHAQDPALEAPIQNQGETQPSQHGDEVENVNWTGTDSTAQDQTLSTKELDKDGFQAPEAGQDSAKPDLEEKHEQEKVEETGNDNEEIKPIAHEDIARSSPQPDSDHVKANQNEAEPAAEAKNEDDAGEVEADNETMTTKTKSPVPTPTPATTIRVDKRKHTTTPADGSGLVQPTLPAINRGHAKVQQIASSISYARKREDIPPTIQTVRSRVPPKLVRLATVTVSPAKSRNVAKGPSLYYEEPKRPQKVITWDEAHNARPPLRVDMEGPGPCSYSPLNKPLKETNAPAYTFGSKCYPEKAGGARTSWGKSWFQSSRLWHNKADYTREGLWPSPNHYPKPPLLGPRQRTMTEAPSFTFGHKQHFSIIKPGAHKEPSPNDYERQNADKLMFRRGPSFSHQFRREGTVLWGTSESNPGPAAYTPMATPRIQKPAYTIQGIRREKSHILGPYSTV